MNNFDYRIPDDMAAEVMAEATRLHAEANKGYSFADLEQACLEANISPAIIQKAIKNIERKREEKRTQRQIMQNRIKEQVQKGLLASIVLIIPAIMISGISLFQSQDKQIETASQSQQKLNSPFKTLTIRPEKLEYLTDPKGLSIAVRGENYGNSVDAMIGTDDYEPLMIKSGKIGDSYKYEGIHNYRIKIIEFSKDRNVTFQIEQLAPEKYTAVERLEEKVKLLEQNSQENQSQQEKLEREKNSKEQQLNWKDETIERLRERIRELQTKSEKLQTKTKQLQTQAQGFKSQLQSQRDSNLQLVNAKSSEVTSLASKIQQLKQESTKLQTQISLLKQQQASDKIELSSKNRTIIDLQDKVKILQQTLDTFKLR
ncbi:hypothetical protein Riv7116_4003 [Rivularia sp. PCC 7116]|uniref:hypothetical protein n=1 Tax=Rivularia sp. PCC 7116 TaxID=373994 RepID=UPI00029F0C32|nr:hypothetical protein [Rivularia sp. PCC 7116]AFY56443.1 hypothetical protein Riv7116_4003 [Rivularia sp. PCC 7116]